MSTIRTNEILHLDGTTTSAPSIPALDQRMAKAWVNFNGVGTVAIRDSYNVSSISDNAVGSYTVNFAVALSTNIAVVGATGESNTQGFVRVGGSSSTSALVNSRQCSNAGTYDDSKVYVVAFSL